MFNRRTLRSSQKKREQRRTLRIRFFVAILLFVTVVSILVWLSYKPNITISRVKIDGTTSLTPAELQKYVAEKLSGKYWLLFPKANIFLYPRRTIREGLLNVFPKLFFATVAFYDFQTIRVSIRERKPFALWCVLLTDNNEEIQNSFVVSDDASVRNIGIANARSHEEKCYFIDDTGVIFSEAPIFSSDNYFKFYGPVSQEKVRVESVASEPLGYYFVPEDTFNKIVEFKNLFDNLGIAPRQFFTRNDGDYEFTLGNGVRILFSPIHDLDILLYNLDAALDTDVLNFDDFIARDPTLDYIDLRFKNRVYYKSR